MRQIILTLLAIAACHAPVSAQSSAAPPQQSFIPTCGQKGPLVTVPPKNIYFRNGQQIPDPYAVVAKKKKPPIVNCLYIPCPPGFPEGHKCWNCVSTDGGTKVPVP